MVRPFPDGAEITLILRGVRVVVFHDDDRLVLHTIDPIDGAYVIREAALDTLAAAEEEVDGAAAPAPPHVAGLH